MSKNKEKQICVHSGIPESVHSAMAILDAQGISSTVKTGPLENQSATVKTEELWVAEKDAEKAKELLKDLPKAPKPITPAQRRMAWIALVIFIGLLLYGFFMMLTGKFIIPGR